MNYLSINKEAWNKKAESHIDSEFYGVEEFLKGKSSLNDIELKLLGDISGKSILHLQCHFGQDSISMQRMGADVLGIDLSDKAIEEAEILAKKANSDARFLCSDVYNLPNVLEEKFDIVFTTYGTIGWLPDLEKWANVIDHFLKPNGEFIFVEFHPMIWMFDYNLDKIAYDYFKTEEIVETETGTYADPNAEIEYSTVSWNHSLGEVFSSLRGVELDILDFQEYDYSPYDCFKNLEKLAERKYRFKHIEKLIPMVYSIKAKK